MRTLCRTRSTRMMSRVRVDNPHTDIPPFCPRRLSASRTSLAVRKAVSAQSSRRLISGIVPGFHAGRLSLPEHRATTVGGSSRTVGADPFGEFFSMDTALRPSHSSSPSVTQIFRRRVRRNRDDFCLFSARQQFSTRVKQTEARPRRARANEQSSSRA